jgi:putative DNA primase/helicase
MGLLGCSDRGGSQSKVTIQADRETPAKSSDPSTWSDSLRTDGELSGILNWAIEGYQRLSEQGHFTNEPTPVDNRERWEQFGSSVDRFFDAHLEADPEAQVAKPEAYDAYTDFASDLGMEVVPQSSLTRHLKQKGGVGDSQRRIDGEKTRVYTGIRQTDD